MSRAPEVALALAGVRVSVSSEVDGMIGWLAEALVPGFTVVAGEEAAQLRVVVTGEPIPCGDLGQSLPCFLNDGGVVRLPGRRRGATCVVEDDRWGARYEIGPGGVRVSPSRPGARLRAAAFRVVREIAISCARATGPVELHASAVRWRGRCVVIAGSKGAGKTTTLARLAASAGAGIVANDRVLLTRAAAGWEVTGVPTIVSVRAPTMRSMSGLFATVPAVARPADLTLREAERAAHGNGTARGSAPTWLTMPQLARQVGGDLVAGGPLACVLALDAGRAAEDFSADPMSRADAAEAFARVRFAAGAAHEPTVFDLAYGAETRERPDGDGIDVPWLRASVGPGFLTSPDAPARLLRTVAGG